MSSWAKDPAIGSRMINARVETISDKPSFRTAFARRRCIVPASGYYEWRTDTSGKQPFYIHPEDGSPLALAGLVEAWRTWPDPASGKDDLLDAAHADAPDLAWHEVDKAVGNVRNNGAELILPA